MQGQVEEHPQSQTIGDGQRQFAVSLCEEVFKKTEGNAFLSPLSASIALTLTWAGAKGQTAEEMASALHLPPIGGPSSSDFHSALGFFLKQLEETRGNVVFKMGNALWVDISRQLLHSFLEQVQFYDAGVQNVDFRTNAEQAREVINNWVEEKTENKIQNLIPRGLLDEETRLVITNAIYFKGLWEVAFKPQQTVASETFHLVGNSGQVQVPMMRLTETLLLYHEESDHVVVGLPYKGRNTALFILLPKQNSVEALQKLSSKDALLSTVSQLSRIGKTKITLRLPRFKTTCTTQLTKVLQGMGMRLAFTEAADFSGMTSASDLKIGAVLHKAFVEVNEEGTEAAAATAVIMKKKGMRKGPRIPVVTVDHPFVFVIGHIPSQSVLFAGRIVDPSQQAD